ncbi:serine protease [Vibrio sagamiensis NBRC 104589]|uniref:Serine protease n=1 Tax=Vibrio sagamiensis NBRC 104589 TaxID=1219064 RepID=A0A511QCZ0_9VIBR|nr:serine protease [Vibrio sagamiensis NBRC 104589]
MHRTGESQFNNLCGGSIINDRYILTAAHCLEGDVFTDGWTIDDLRVLVKNPTMDDVYLEEFKDVRSFKIHPDYDENNLWVNDIAIIELSYPITDNVQSITLPQDFGDYSNQSIFQIFGLGQTSTSNSIEPTRLLWAEVKPLTDVECISMITGFNSEESLCVTGVDNRPYTGICSGDSGGPLTYQDNNGQYQQIGITSYGSSICESPRVPSVFTEVLHYTAWIEAHSSSGEKTIYDQNLAEKENYYSKGDNGFQPEETSDSSPESNTESASGGTIHFFWLLVGGILTYYRRRNY